MMIERSIITATGILLQFYNQTSPFTHMGLASKDADRLITIRFEANMGFLVSLALQCYLSVISNDVDQLLLLFSACVTQAPYLINICTHTNIQP